MPVAYGESWSPKNNYASHFYECRDGIINMQTHPHSKRHLQQAGNNHKSAFTSPTWFHRCKSFISRIRMENMGLGFMRFIPAGHIFNMGVECIGYWMQMRSRRHWRKQQEVVGWVIIEDGAAMLSTAMFTRRVVHGRVATCATSNGGQHGAHFIVAMCSQHLKQWPFANAE